MSNYTSDNLINVPAANVPAGTLALKVGSDVFTAGNVVVNQGTDFYKCASVDTTNYTWTGHKAVLSGGIYTYESTATTGLTYNPEKITPVVDLCYTDGALLLISPYDSSQIPVDANTMFLLQGSLHDKSGHVADSAITNHGITFTGWTLNCSNGGYASIAANALPDSVLCDDKDWTFEASVTITSVSRSQAIFGRDMDDSPRGDIVAYTSFWYTNTSGNQLQNDTTREGTHIIKLTHTSANKFSLYVDGTAGYTATGSDIQSGRDYRTYALYIGSSGDNISTFNNIINWIRISDCIR